MVYGNVIHRNSRDADRIAQACVVTTYRVERVGKQPSRSNISNHICSGSKPEGTCNDLQLLIGNVEKLEEERFSSHDLSLARLSLIVSYDHALITGVITLDFGRLSYDTIDDSDMRREERSQTISKRSTSWLLDETCCHDKRPAAKGRFEPVTIIVHECLL